MLRADVARDMRRSADAFKGVVWPRIREHCGGGYVVPVESADGDPDPALEALDRVAGIDYLQIVDDGRLSYGLAVRVQPVPERRGWDTFTVRRSRASGASTELEKRVQALNALHKKPIWPAWTVQAYVTDDRVCRLISVGVIETVALYAHIQTGREGSAFWIRATVNAEFLCVAWDALPSYWAPFIWRDCEAER